MKTGYVKVQLNYAPKTNGKKFREWCGKNGFDYIGGGRRAWSSSLRTYLRGSSGIAYADGEPFLFDEEDVIDIANREKKMLEFVIGEDLQLKPTPYSIETDNALQHEISIQNKEKAEARQRAKEWRKKNG